MFAKKISRLFPTHHTSTATMDDRGRVSAFKGALIIKTDDETTANTVVLGFTAAAQDLPKVREVVVISVTADDTGASFTAEFAMRVKQTTLGPFYQDLEVIIAQNALEGVAVHFKSTAVNASDALNMAQYRALTHATTATTTTTTPPSVPVTASSTEKHTERGAQLHQPTTKKADKTVPTANDAQWVGLILPVTYTTDTIYDMERGQIPPMMPDEEQWSEHLQWTVANGLACAKKVAVVPRHTIITSANEGLHTEPPNSPVDSPFHIHEPHKSNRTSIMFEIYIETHRRLPAQVVKNVINVVKNVLQKTPTGFLLNLHTTPARCMVSDVGVRTPWPLVTNKVVPYQVNLNSWMQENATESILTARHCDIVGSKDSVEQTLAALKKWELAGAAAAGKNRQEFLEAALLKLQAAGLEEKNADLKRKVEAAELTNTGYVSLLSDADKEYKKLSAKLASVNTRNQSMRGDLAELQVKWNDMYQAKKSKKG